MRATERSATLFYTEIQIRVVAIASLMPGRYNFKRKK